MQIPAPLYHITTRSQWQDAERSGAYEGDTLATEGFIHCSEDNQIERVANARFQGRKDLVLLLIDRERVAPEVVHEATEGTEEFPHIYGPLNLDAVFDVRPIAPEDDGSFRLP